MCTIQLHPSCNLLLLIGLKGAGKTFLGGVLERHLGIKFLRIEPLFVELMREEPELSGVALEHKGFQQVIDQLDELAKTDQTLCIESTGAAHTFPEWLTTLRQGYRVWLIRVTAPLDVCAQRVMSRDTTAHIPVSDHRLQEINAVAAQVNLPWDLEIDNTEFQDEATLVQAVQGLLQGG